MNIRTKQTISGKSIRNAIKEKTLCAEFALEKTDSELSAKDICGINKKNVDNFLREIIECISSHQEEKFKNKFSLLEKMVRRIDEIKDEESEIATALKQYYNIIAFSAIYDILFSYLKNKKRKYDLTMQLEVLQKYQNYREILQILEQEKLLSQSELATKMKVSPQNLANYLAKIKDEGIVVAYKFPMDKKATYYGLSYRVVEMLNEKRNAELSETNDWQSRGDYKYNRDYDISSGKEYYTANYDNEQFFKIPRRLLENG